MSARPWTAAELAILRRDYLTVPVTLLSAQLRRGKLGIHFQAAALGLRKPMRRPWTAEEREIVRRDYLTMPAAQLAAKLGRPQGSVHQQAAILGVARKRIPINNLLIWWAGARVRDGFCNRCLARVWSAKFPGCAPLARCTFRRMRRERGWPESIGQACSECHAGQRAVDAQKKTLGIRHGGDLRAMAYRKFAGENGWPEELRPREVQILNALAARGVSMTMLELATAIGMRTDRRDAHHAHVLLSGNGPGGTYTASLARGGYLIRHVRGTGGHRGCRDLYSLGPRALDILHRRAACQRATENTAV